MYLKNILTTEDIILTSTTTDYESTTASTISEDNNGFSWDIATILLLLLFAAIQISIWSFFIFCYFARRKPQPINKILSSVSTIDLPPEYDIAINKTVFTPYPMDNDLPTYTEVVSSGSLIGVKSHSETTRCSCVVTS